MCIDEILVFTLDACSHIASQRQCRHDLIIFPSYYDIHSSQTVNKCLTNSAILSINQQNVIDTYKILLWHYQTPVILFCH